VSHWLDDSAQGLADGRFSRRQVLNRGVVALAGALAASFMPLRRRVLIPAVKTCGDQHVPQNWKCCGSGGNQVGYDPRTHECCDQRPAGDLNGAANTVCSLDEGGCCGLQCEKDVCTGSNMACCSDLEAPVRSTCYDFETHTCCGNGEACPREDGCCGYGPLGGPGAISSATCTSKYCKTPGNKCCHSDKSGDFCYDPTTHFCCPYPNEHPCRKGQTCCDVDGCCDTLTEDCCGGKCVPKGTCRRPPCNPDVKGYAPCPNEAPYCCKNVGNPKDPGTCFPPTQTCCYDKYPTTKAYVCPESKPCNICGDGYAVCCWGLNDGPAPCCTG